MANKLTQFWLELKRRKVFKVIAMYAGAAYVLIELAGNVVAPLNLPGWTPRLVIIIAIIGLPIAAVISWIFDMTPEGITKTGSEETPVGEETSESAGKRRLKFSDIVIAILVVIVGVLAYPRIFKSGSSLNAMTVPISVVNEFGEKETRRVFKEEYISRLAIFPFQNEERDTSLNWIQGVIFDGISEDFLQFHSIITERNFSATHLNEQIDYARSNNCSHFLTGLFSFINGVYEFNSKLYQTTSGALVAEWTSNGWDLLGLIDSICHKCRNELEVPEIILNATLDLPLSELVTDNLDAYRYYVESGINYFDNPPISAHTQLYHAFQLDSTFACALLRSAFLTYIYQNSRASASRDIEQAMRHRHRLSEYREIDVRRYYYLIGRETEKAIALAEWQYELNPNDFRLLEDLTNIYRKNQSYDKFESSVYKLNEIVPGHPPYQILLARTYLFTGKYSKGLRVLDKLLMENPENIEALLNKGKFHLHMNDPEAAESVINKIVLLMPEEEKNWSMLLDHIAYIREKGTNKAQLESFIGEYRDNESELHISISSHNNNLHAKGENQGGFFFYPVSDTVFVTILKSDTEYLFIKQPFIRNTQGKVKGFSIEQNNAPGAPMVWKEDSMILEAKDLLKKGKFSEALAAFQEAYDVNPEHYYLAHFIQHLELVLSPEYKELSPIIRSHLGEYEDLVLYSEDTKLFYRDNLGFLYELLPLSEGKFMIPSKYNALIEIEKEKDGVTGLKFIYRNGHESFYPKISKQALAGQNQ